MTPPTDAEREVDLDAIRAREMDATPGPWTNEDGSVVALEWLTMPEYHADAEFIAHAREDVPALLRLVDRLKTTQAVEALRLTGIIDKQAKEIEELRASHDRRNWVLPVDGCWDTR